MAAAAAPNAEPNLTSGKADFNDLYNGPDAAPYINEMGSMDYQIADNSARINRRVIESLCRDTGSDGQKPVVMELCAGYGLTMAPIRSTQNCATLFPHYLQPRPDIWEARRRDAAFLASAKRSDFPDITVVGVDVAENALAYGKEVGLFDEFIAKNLEDPEAILTTDETALVRRVRLVMATGAFSYITATTLTALFNCFPNAESMPVFMFFPLVASDVRGVIRFFEEKGMQIHYERAKDWLPQRRFHSDKEAERLNQVQEAACAGNPPPSFRKGWVHAVPLLVCPPGQDIKKLAAEWIVAPLPPASD